MRGWNVLLLAGAVVLPGCLDDPFDLHGGDECRLDDFADLVGLPPGVEGKDADPRQPRDSLLLGQRLDVASGRDETAPRGWEMNVTTLSPAGHEPSLLQVRLKPGPDPQPGRWNVQVETRVEQAECSSSRSTGEGGSIGIPTPGRLAAPGKGTVVQTAGFWENGTLFYTNIFDLHNSDWARAGWYDSGVWEPLKVYVYDAERAERSALWAPATAVPTEADDVAPVGPTVAENTWTWFTTIRGFNEALKGLSTTTARVVRIAPEDAYTWPGNEDHPLYGDALVFYIRLVGVVDYPCEEPLVVAACNVPIV